LRRLAEAERDGTPIAVLASELGISPAKVSARAYKLGLRFGHRLPPAHVYPAYHPQVSVDSWRRLSDALMRQIATSRA